MKKLYFFALLFILILGLYKGGESIYNIFAKKSSHTVHKVSKEDSNQNSTVTMVAKDKSTEEVQSNSTMNDNADQEATNNPDSITVLVNKEYALPDNYKPTDLVYPNVPFTFSAKVDKRMMRTEAAAALQQLFAGAKSDGIDLLGVSAYRSYDTQKTLFNSYAQQDGEQKAETYSAVPGHSEHETGLAIDVTGGNGKCAAESCFAGTKEANWLANHAYEYGFIVRYPKGKESITGYEYEPWHIRYVGKKVAKEIQEKGITLEEYMGSLQVASK